jgi:hypothetical protein
MNDVNVIIDIFQEVGGKGKFYTLGSFVIVCLCAYRKTVRYVKNYITAVSHHFVNYIIFKTAWTLPKGLVMLRSFGHWFLHL